MMTETQQQTVLFVDDDMNILSGMFRGLHNQPYKIMSARSGQDAIGILQRLNIDLVVTDEKMPGMSGSELLVWITKHLPHVVRIVLTGQPDIPSAISAINEGGIFRYFTKPFDQVELAMAIREGLEYGQKQASLAEK